MFAETRTAILDEFCFQPGEYLVVLDANGDRFLDMTCHSSTGQIQIAEGHIYYHDGKVCLITSVFKYLSFSELNSIEATESMEFIEYYLQYFLFSK